MKIIYLKKECIISRGLKWPEHALSLAMAEGLLPENFI